MEVSFNMKQLGTSKNCQKHCCHGSILNARPFSFKIQHAISSSSKGAKYALILISSLGLPGSSLGYRDWKFFLPQLITVIFMNYFFWAWNQECCHGNKIFDIILSILICLIYKLTLIRFLHKIAELQQI